MTTEAPDEPNKPLQEAYQRLLNMHMDTLITHGPDAAGGLALAIVAIHKMLPETEEPATPETSGTEDSESLPIHTVTDEELWDSPLGLRLRAYADKLLAAEQQRIEMTARRQSAYALAAGVAEARGLISGLGRPFDRDDAWAKHTSDEILGLREVIAATNGDQPDVQKAAKKYIAELTTKE